MYDYTEAIKQDIRQWIGDDDGYRFNLADYKHTYDHFRDTVARKICDDLYNYMCQCDSVTGYMSGYDMPDECRKHLEGNMNLAETALAAHEQDIRDYLRNEDWVGIDCNIRGYLLYACLITIVITEILPVLENLTEEE